MGLRTTARLNMGPTRGWEEDVIFEGKCDVLSETWEGSWLDDGAHPGCFTPGMQAGVTADRTGSSSRSSCRQAWPTTHDWHHNRTEVREPSSPVVFELRTRRITRKLLVQSRLNNSGASPARRLRFTLPASFALAVPTVDVG